MEPPPPSSSPPRKHSARRCTAPHGRSSHQHATGPDLHAAQPARCKMVAVGLTPRLNSRSSADMQTPQARESRRANSQAREQAPSRKIETQPARFRRDVIVLHGPRRLMLRGATADAARQGIDYTNFADSAGNYLAQRSIVTDTPTPQPHYRKEAMILVVPSTAPWG